MKFEIEKKIYLAGFNAALRCVRAGVDVVEENAEVMWEAWRDEYEKRLRAAIDRAFLHGLAEEGETDDGPELDERTISEKNGNSTRGA